MALGAVPSGTRTAPGDRLSFPSWLRSGSYSVVSTTPKRFNLEGVSTEMGAVLLAEAGFLLDHAQEHAMHIRHQLAGGRWFSSAWLSVSVYYWAFFIASALAKMRGKSPCFLSDSQARALRQLAPLTSGTAGAGLRIVSCEQPTSLTMREISIKQPSQSRVHDAVWKLWFGEVRELVRKADVKSASQELRIYLPQVLAANALGDSWPSDYRNLVNYVPGLAYGAARGRTPTATFATISTSGRSAAEALSRLETDSTAISPDKSIGDQLAACTRLLLSTTIVLDSLANELFREIILSRELDRRWLTARYVLAKTQYKNFEDVNWPVTLG